MMGSVASLFDIVNGFLKSMPYGMGLNDAVRFALLGSGRPMLIIRLSILIIRTKILRLCCSAEFWLATSQPSIVVGGADSQA